MLNEIGFGLIDNGILVGSAIAGFSLEDIINDGLAYVLRETRFILKTRIKGLSGSLLGAGVGNAVSDFFGGLCISSNMAWGTFFGCMIIVLISLPLIFKMEKKNEI